MSQNVNKASSYTYYKICEWLIINIFREYIVLKSVILTLISTNIIRIMRIVEKEREREFVCVCVLQQYFVTPSFILMLSCWASNLELPFHEKSINQSINQYLFQTVQ